jgi:hypothetical protein
MLTESPISQKRIVAGKCYRIVTAYVLSCPFVARGGAAIYFTFASTQDIVNALRGETNPNDLPEKLGDNAVKALTARVGTWVIISACSNPGTMTIALVILGC